MKNFRWPVLAMIGGFILGPAISSIIDFFHVSLKLSSPFFIAVFLAVINWILLYVTFKETRKVKEKNTRLTSLVIANLSSVFYVVKKPEVRMLSVGYCLFMFGFSLFFQSISLCLAQSFGYTPRRIGLFFIFLGFALAFSTLYLQPKLENINFRKLILLSLSTMGILFLLLSLFCFVRINMIQSITWIICGFFYLIFPFATLGTMTLFSGAVSRKEQGQIMGGLGQMSSIMMFFPLSLWDIC